MKTITAFGIITMSLLSFAASAEDKPQQQPSGIQQIGEGLHELYSILLDQIDVMRSQQQDLQVLRIDIARLTAACGRRPPAPPVYVEPER